METETSTIECKESPDGKHCWHGVIGATVSFIPGGTNECSESCCWCGETRGYVVTLPLSYTVNITPHGPYFQTRMYYTKEEDVSLLR